MKQLIVGICFFLCSASCIAETFYVKLADTSGFRALVNEKWNSKKHKVDYPFSSSVLKFMRNTARVTFADTLVDMPELFKLSSAVLSVHPQVIYHTDYVPNDSLYAGYQWNLRKIQAEQAWNISSGEAFIKIAVLDDAIDIGHKDIRDNIALNIAEIPGNGIDDDSNGYIDDYKGFDVSTQSPEVSPPDTNYKHGTHVAGIVSASTGNVSGVASLCYGAKLLPVKCSNNFALGVTHGLEGIIYAIDAGARVVNMSWGSLTPDGLMQQVIDSASANGRVIFVAAAGNGGDTLWNYPAAYPQVVSVSATNSSDFKLGSSTYGQWVSIAAPGQSIMSTLPANRYGLRSGTSMAAPLVSSALGLLYSYKEYLSRQEALDCLLGSTDPLPDQSIKYGAGRLNAYGMLLCAGNLGISRVESEETVLHGSIVFNSSNKRLNIKVYSILGMNMGTFGLNPGEEIDLGTCNFTPGIYFIYTGRGKAFKILIANG